jgi:hypothetical protein
VGHQANHRTNGDDHVGAGAAGDLDDAVAERPPPQVRLDPGTHDQVPAGSFEVERVPVVLGPHDIAAAVVAQPHLGTFLLEVVEGLGVGGGDALVGVAIAQPRQRRSGCLAGIEQALEGHDHDGSVEGCVTLPEDLAHPCSPSGSSQAPMIGTFARLTQPAGVTALRPVIAAPPVRP